MKLNLEIDLDWIDEDSSIDDVVKQQIISGVMNKINKSVLGKIEARVDSMLDKTIVKRIDKATDKMFKNFLKRPIQITDNYGSTIKQYGSITEVMKERFDNFMVQKVNDKGNTSQSSYETKFTRLSFIVDKQLKDFANEFTTNAVKKVSAEIKAHVKDGLTTKLGAELMSVLKINQMLELPSKNGK